MPIHTPSRIFNLANILGFQLIWWTCILFGNIALPIAVILISCHIYFHQKPAEEIRVILFCGLAGFLTDTLLTSIGVFAFDAQAFSPLPPASLIPPLWLAALWFAFSATLRNSLNYFRERLVLASLLGAISGAGSYIAAERLGAVNFPCGLPGTSLALMLIWAVLFPALILVSKQLEADYVS